MLITKKKKKKKLILGEGPTQGLDKTTPTAKKNLQLVLLKVMQRFV